MTTNHYSLAKVSTGDEDENLDVEYYRTACY